METNDFRDEPEHAGMVLHQLAEYHKAGGELLKLLEVIRFHPKYQQIVTRFKAAHKAVR